MRPRLAATWLAPLDLPCGDSRGSPITVYGYRSTITAARRVLGKALVQEITRADIEDLISQMVGKGVAKRTVEYLLSLLRQIFNRALDDDLIVKNPALRVKPAGKPSTKPTAFSEAELRQVRKAIAGHRLEAGFMLTLNGLRRSEVLG